MLHFLQIQFCSVAIHFCLQVLLKKWYLKLISIVAASWVLKAHWRDTNSTVHFHSVTAFKAGYTSSDPKVCGHNRGKFLLSTTLGISWSQMWWRLFQPLHLLFTLFKHSICSNLCSKSGIGNMGHGKYGYIQLHGKNNGNFLMLTAALCCTSSARAPLFFFPIEIYLEIIKESNIWALLLSATVWEL